MIFVTVGTHEQPFNRLIKEVDRLKGLGLINEEVIIQKGYSTYIPKYCLYEDFFPWDKMQKLNKEATVVITHGGPASFIDVLMLGKTPIVVPRLKEFKEHVNNHQLYFADQLLLKKENIIVVHDINEIFESINMCKEMNKKNLYVSNNKEFNRIIEDYSKKLYNVNN